MTERTRVARDELAEITAQLPLDLRDRLNSITTPLLDRADDVATLLDYRRKIAIGDLVSPVDEADSYMQGLGDAMSVLLRTWDDAYDQSEIPAKVDQLFDTVAEAFCELGYARRDPDPLIDRDNSRGLGQLPDLPGAYGGGVRVYESSAASWPHVWLKVSERVHPNDTESPLQDATVHLPAETAWLLARYLVASVRGHYHEPVIADLTTPEAGDLVMVHTETGATIATMDEGALMVGTDASSELVNVFVVRKADES